MEPPRGIEPRTTSLRVWDDAMLPGAAWDDRRIYFDDYERLAVAADLRLTRASVPGCPAPGM